MSVQLWRCPEHQDILEYHRQRQLLRAESRAADWPTVSVDVNCTHMFLRVLTTQKPTKRLIRRLARWLQLAHQTRGGEHRLGLTGALDEGMRCWLKRGFGGRSIVESMTLPRPPSHLGTGAKEASSWAALLFFVSTLAIAEFGEAGTSSRAPGNAAVPRGARCGGLALRRGRIVLRGLLGRGRGPASTPERRVRSVLVWLRGPCVPDVAALRRGGRWSVC